MGSDAKDLKRQAAEEALRAVSSGMSIGLGTGSTADQFTRALARSIEQGALRELRFVATSSATEKLAATLGLSCLAPDELPQVDLTVDGADEIDAGLRLIKGRGGALLREKIVAQASTRYLIIADESKLVPRLGQGPLPVELVVFATRPLMLRFEKLGLEPQPRLDHGQWYRTDEGHRIIDISLPHDRDITDVVDELSTIAGVVDTGFFPREATEVLIAGTGGIQRKTRPAKK